MAPIPRPVTTREDLVVFCWFCTTACLLFVTAVEYTQQDPVPETKKPAFDLQAYLDATKDLLVLMRKQIAQGNYIIQRHNDRLYNETHPYPGETECRRDDYDPDYNAFAEEWARVNARFTNILT